MTDQKSKKTPEETPSASKSPSQDNCPFARNGIVEGLKQLTEEGGLLERAVLEQKKGNKLTRESNELAKKNSKMLRAVILLFLGSVLILLAVSGLAWLIFKDVATVEQNMGKSVAKQDGLIEDVKKLVTQAKKTDEKLDDAKDAIDARPSVELVPEPDPEKAKDAPIKVRIIPPKNPKSGGEKHHPPAPTQTAVEVPLPVKDAKALRDEDF
jgi:hypothetical protein